MSVFDQFLLDVHDELIVDLFAGGGGASCGIEMATGRQVDVAINHDADAVAMHEANHPQTRHMQADVFEVDPREATDGRPVGLLWASPDCTDHSSAKGGKPIRTSKRRALAWVVQRWAGQVRPRVIMLENVPEFAGWGPLVGPPGKLRRNPKRAGRTFRRFMKGLEGHGYRVESRELVACDYGAPTSRKRLYMIARCDGRPIVWPEPSHGPGTRLRYRTAADCIDWAIPMLSIFATPDETKDWARDQREAGWPMGTPRRPLADNTMQRIARGVMQYVVEADEPFIVRDRIAPTLVQSGYGERKGQAPRTLDLQEPLGTIVAGGQKHALVAAFLAKHFTGVTGSDLRDPIGTVTTVDHHSLVYAFLSAYYGQGVGQAPGDPLRTITTKDRLGLVAVDVGGGRYHITDIALRMLQPRELYAAQGFPPGYVFNRGKDGRRLTKSAQVRMCGNSVSPPQVAALVRTNLPGLIVRDEARVA